MATNRGSTPTPAVSHAILSHNRRRTAGLADGIVVTPSHPWKNVSPSVTRYWRSRICGRSMVG
ncbi:MAG: hypothetical protein DMD33_01890 [Gemmatimonadetes bacterium]|nr:MAG: hypothetical protein DMD33_01890 [Gemmatimonadota bacterium]